MAGIAGMASPNQVQPIDPQAPIPQPVDIPQVAQPTQASAPVIQPTQDMNPLDAIYGSAQAAPDNSHPLDAIYGQAPAPKEDSLMSKAGDVVSGVAGFVSKMADTFDRVTLAPVRGAVDSYISGENPLYGAAKGVVGTVPTMDKLIEKIAPITKTKIPLPITDAQTYGEERAGNLIGEGSTNYVNKGTVDTMPVSQALGLASDIYLGNAVIKGMSRIPGVVKATTVALGDYYDAQKAASLLKAQSSVLSPVKQAELASSSLKTTIDELNKVGANIKLTPNVVDLSNAHEVEIAKGLSNNAQFQAVQVKQGEDIADAILKHSEAFANIAPKAGGAQEAFKVVTGAADAEGRLLGNFRDQAAALAGDGQLPTTAFKTKINDIVDKAGFSIRDGKLIRPDLEQAALAMNIPQDEAKDLIPRLESYYQKMFNNNGRLTYDELRQLYQKDIGSALKSAQKKDYNVQQILNDLRKSAGEDLRNLTGTILSDSNPKIAAQYKEANDNFSKIMKSYENIPTMLNRDEMTSDSFVKYLTSGNADLDKIKSVQNILKIENPELIKDINGALVNKIFFDNMQTATANSPLKYDFAGIKNDFKKLAGMNGERLDAITGSAENSKKLMQFVDVAEAIGKGTTANKAVISESLVSRAMYLASKIGAPKEFVSEGILMANRDKNLMRYLDEAGIQRALKVAPPSDRPAFSNYLRSIVNFTHDKAEQKLKNEVRK